jgi:hypothetical protein
MATTREDIQGWFERGVREQHEYLLVVTDTYDWEDYPVYVARAEQVTGQLAEYSLNMQRVTEVYDLRAPMVEQLNEHRAWRVPSFPYPSPTEA